MRTHCHALWPTLALAALLAAPAFAQAPAAKLPEVMGPIAVTASSKPFLGDQAVLAALGYVEEEFFLSGRANVYDWAGPGRQVKIVAGPTPYTTRILVRRPRDPAKFSGNVEVNILNASGGMDAGSFLDGENMTKQGDAWVGITTKAITADS